MKVQSIKLELGRNAQSIKSMNEVSQKKINHYKGIFLCDKIKTRGV